MLCHVTILKLPGLMLAPPVEASGRLAALASGWTVLMAGAATISCGKYYPCWKLQSFPKTAVSSRSWEGPQAERTGKLRAPQREH